MPTRANPFSPSSIGDGTTTTVSVRSNAADAPIRGDALEDVGAGLTAGEHDDVGQRRRLDKAVDRRARPLGTGDEGEREPDGQGDKRGEGKQGPTPSPDV